MNEISGCDFSQHSGKLDYAKAKSVMRFALIRATQGIGGKGFGFVANGFKDVRFDDRWAEIVEEDEELIMTML